MGPRSVPRTKRLEGGQRGRVGVGNAIGQGLERLILSMAHGSWMLGDRMRCRKGSAGADRGRD